MFGRASNIRDASVPPMSMNGRRRPPQNHTLSLMSPITTWPTIPASGPAAHTKPTWWISRWYFVVNSQLSAEIWIDSANPIAVDGRLISA